MAEVDISILSLHVALLPHRMCPWQATLRLAAWFYGGVFLSAVIRLLAQHSPSQTALDRTLGRLLLFTAHNEIMFAFELNKGFSIQRAFESCGATCAILIAMASMMHKNYRTFIGFLQFISSFDQLAYVLRAIFIFPAHMSSNSINNHEPRSAECLY